jgi:hypothetical protein
MKFARLLILFSALVTAVSAADANGKWTLKFLGDPGKMPKTVAEINLDLKSDGKVLTGVTQAGSWPGEMIINDGKVDGNRISFSVVGKSPWQASSPQHGKSSGYPRLTFKGTIEGNQIKMNLSWDSVMIHGNSENKPREYELAGERVQ